MIVPECRVSHDGPPIDGAGGGLATASSCAFLLRTERSNCGGSLLLNSSLDTMRCVSSGFVEKWLGATGAATVTGAGLTTAGTEDAGAALVAAGVSGAVAGKSRHSST